MIFGIQVGDTSNQNRPQGHLLIRYKTPETIEYETYEGEMGEFGIATPASFGNCKILMPPNQVTDYTK